MICHDDELLDDEEELDELWLDDDDSDELELEGLPLLLDDDDDDVLLEDDDDHDAVERMRKSVLLAGSVLTGT